MVYMVYGLRFMVYRVVLPEKKMVYNLESTKGCHVCKIARLKSDFCSLISLETKKKVIVNPIFLSVLFLGD